MGYRKNTYTEGEIQMEYNAEKMSQLIKNDPYLKFMFNDMLKRGYEEEEALVVLYNSEVDEAALGDYRHVYNRMERSNK